MTRVLVHWGLAYVLLTLSEPLLWLAGIELLALDLGAVIALYAAFSAPPSERSSTNPHTVPCVQLGGAAICLGCGYLVDVINGSATGTHCFVLVLLYLLARLAAGWVAFQGVLARFVIGFVGALTSALIDAALQWSFQPQIVDLTAGALAVMAASAMATGLVAVPLFGLLGGLDRLLSRQRRRVFG